MHQAFDQPAILEKNSIDRHEKYSEWLSSIQLELNFEPLLPESVAGVVHEYTLHRGTECVSN